MMLVADCPKLHEYMAAYLDGTLPTEERGAVELHLNTCHACRDGLKRYQAVQNLLKGALGPETLRPDFAADTGKRMNAITSGVLPTVIPEDAFEPAPRLREKNLGEKVMQRLGGAPWWAISGTFHALLILLLALLSMTLIRSGEKDVVILTNFERRPPVEEIKKEQPRDVLRELPALEISDRPAVEAPVVVHEEIEVADASETADNADTSDARGEQGIADVMLGGTGSVANLGVGGGGGGAFGRPAGGGARLRRAIAGGGGKPTESAVDKALEWLARNQEADGRWDSKKHGGAVGLWEAKPGDSAVQVDVAVTGFALLAFLGAGHSEKVGKYKENVQRGVRWLAAQQQDNGFLCAPQYNYSQSIAGMALSEAAGMGRVPDTIKAAQKAIDATCGKGTKVEDLSERGGWSYAIPQHATITGDLSNSGWTIMFLKSARTAGLKVPAQAFDGAIRFLDACEIKDPRNPNDLYSRHHYNYGPLNGQALAFDDAKAQITFVGLLNRQFMGAPREELQKAAEWAMNKGKVPNNGKWGYQGLYYIYYGTLVAFQQGGDMWKEWNAALKETLLPTQIVGGVNDGSWDPHGAYGTAWGRVGQTALSAMCLEVYYRYLPLYR